MKKLVRSKTDSKICGICGGIALYFGIDSTLVRVIFVVCTFLSGFVPAIILYFILACLIPLETDIIE